MVYTVTSPAIAPIPKVMLLGSVCPGGALLCTSCLSVVYVVNRTAEFAPICGVVYECEPRGAYNINIRHTLPHHL